MAKSKKKGGSGQRISRKQDPIKKDKPNVKKTDEPAIEKPRVSERVHETDAGFGVIKAVVIAIVILILAATVLSRLSGTNDLSRGDKGQDESCQSTTQCKKGFVCHPFRGKAKTCMQLCSPGKKECDIGYKCISDARIGRKKARIRTICAKDVGL